MAIRFIIPAAAGLLAISGAAQAQDAAPAPVAAADCTFTSNDSEEITFMLRERGAYLDDFDGFCSRLNALRMGVNSNGYAFVGDTGTTAVVLLKLYALESGTRSEATTFGFVNVAGVDANARLDALSGAYNNAIGAIAADLTTYVASAVEEGARLDGLYRAGVPTATLPPAEPCEITYRSTPEIEAMLTERGALPEFAAYDAFCQTLRANAAGLEFASGAMMVGSESHVWVSVGVYDLATLVSGTGTGYSISITPDATSAGSSEDVLATLQAGLEGLAAEVDGVLATLASTVADDRAFYPVD